MQLELMRHLRTSQFLNQFHQVSQNQDKILQKPDYNQDSSAHVTLS